MRGLLLWSLFVFLPAAVGLTPNEIIYKDRNAGIDARVSDLVSRMTLQEKVDLLAGTGFATKPNSRLQIPALKMTDGPLGVRWQRSTSFPAGIAMAASFDRDLIRKVTGAMGEEARAKGRDMILGPCVGISRIPFGGRNFESMGEDPFLTSEMAAAYIHGLDDQHVVGSVKHFALNDQEYDRQTIDSIADERTMHEIHLVAFERAVQEGVGSVMASYNLVNGKHSTENDVLLNQILKHQWGFRGFVVSDWGATHSTVPAALAGLDLEMPTPEYFGSKLLNAVQQSEVPVSLIDDKVSRILRVMFKAGLFDGADTHRPDPSVINDDAHRAIALQMAREGQVLLKNQAGTLPLENVKKIAVIGPNAGVARTGGGGSSFVQPFYSISPAEGLLNRVAGTDVQISYALGVQQPGDISAIEPMSLRTPDGKSNGLYGEYFKNTDLSGQPLFTRVDSNVNFYWDDETYPDPRLGRHNYSIRWTGQVVAPVTGVYQLKTNSDDGVRLWLDDQLVIDNWKEHGPEINSVSVRMLAGYKYKIRLEYFQAGGGAMVQLGWTPPADALLRQAIMTAQNADAVVVAVGFDSDLESEGIDRDGFGLPAGQDALINSILRVNPRTIVVINTGNPVGMSAWIDRAPAVIYSWYPGEQGGNALADVLLGNYNPSGRLPISMPKRWEDSPAYGTYPGQNGQVIYKEGIYVGYRYYDKSPVVPLFPFGHGLSYTKFEYTGLTVNSANNSAGNPDIEVDVTITNTGHRAGTEVAQLYVHDDEPKVDRPVQELKGFERVFLQPGQSQLVKFKLNKFSFAFYDVTSHGWKALPGKFTVRVGGSSRDIRLEGDVQLFKSNTPVALAKDL